MFATELLKWEYGIGLQSFFFCFILCLEDLPLAVSSRELAGRTELGQSEINAVMPVETVSDGQWHY